MAGSVNPKAGHSAEWWKQRIAYLDRKQCKNGKELQETISQLVEAHAGYTRAAIVAAVVREFGTLVLQTPVDTGRARAGWQIGTAPTEWVPSKAQWDEYKGTGAVTRALASVPVEQLSQADVIYICNNVEYILALEAGWSAQAPRGFIGLFIQRLNTQLTALAAKL